LKQLRENAPFVVNHVNFYQETIDSSYF